MNIHGITMARDEAHILPVFANHVIQFFDEWYLLDQRPGRFPALIFERTRTTPQIDNFMMAFKWQFLHYERHEIFREVNC